MQNCVILAGGKSSRMGKDKTLLPFKDSPTLTHFVAKKMSKIFKNVYVSSKFNKFTPQLNLIKDIKTDDYSPMLALYSILLNFNSHVFIIPADMPFVKINSIKKMAEFINEYDVIIAKDSSHRHSLCGFFSSNLAQKAKELYESKQHKIGILLNSCKLKEVDFKNESEFFNINYPQDYKKAISNEVF